MRPFRRRDIHLIHPVLTHPRHRPRLKNQKIHKLQDVVMRPHISGRKTMGTLEAHANGLRFRSKKQEVRMCLCCVYVGVYVSTPRLSRPRIRSIYPSIHSTTTGGGRDVQ